MRVGLLTKEWPPDVYGGAGVHVEFLARELASLVDLRVEPFAAHPAWGQLAGANPALQVFSSDLSITASVADRDLVHSHTWYANLAGHLAKLLYGIPHVMTAHSLEPLRPWKAEQLGGGYALSSWAERTAIEAADAVIAVSAGMRADVLSSYDVDPARVHVVHNGIDTDLFAPRPDSEALAAAGLDPQRPTAIFVGRITRQKGLPHLLRAMRRVDPAVQLLLCASAPDTPELAAEVESAVARLTRARTVVWLRDVVPRPQLIALLSSATVFVCPSVYEPLGIVNLEAMACGTAVVASAVGGIPEVVDDGVTGRLVPCDEADPAGFEAGLADAISALAGDPATASAMGAAGRQRTVAEFGWPRIARQTVEVYEGAVKVAGAGETGLAAG
jgi:starch synthase